MDQWTAVDAKEQIRQAVDVVDLVGSYLTLRRSGRNFVGQCPWHDDARPSLQVNPERQTWKCWPCDIGGDIFSFVMRIEGVEFPEALEMLAERAGVTLKPVRQAGSPPSRGGPGDKRVLYRAMAWAEELFHRCLLNDPEAQEARDYLTEREISAEIVQRFRLGFSPNRWDWLLAHAPGGEMTSAVLERVGLAIKRDTGDGYYDRFRGRLLFSIRDARGRPIAFGGRVLPSLADDRSAKYINSPETPLFSKSRELYGLDHARDAIGKNGRVIVMEGYTDCLMAQQHGIPEAVAVLGTALGERHLPLLRRFTDSIVLVLDGDEAGRRRTNEILELFVGNQVDLRILTLPDGADPCDFIASQGGEEFRRLVSQAADALEHKLSIESNGLDVDTDTHQATVAAERVLSTLAKARPGAGIASSTMLLREQQMLTRIARHFHLPEPGLQRRLNDFRRKNRRPPTASSSQATPDNTSTAPRPTVALKQWASWERELLEIILLDANHITTIAQQIEAEAIQAPLARELYEKSIELAHDDPSDMFSRLMLHAESENAKQAIIALDDSSQAKSASDMSLRLHDLMESYRDRTKKAQQTAAADSSSRADATEALLEFVSQARPSQLTRYQRRKQ